MRFMFRNDALFTKMEESGISKIDSFAEDVFGIFVNVKRQIDFDFYAADTWMCLQRGEGEKEIENHGWSRVKESFSQETGARSQPVSWIDTAKMKRPKQHSKS